MKKKLLYIAGIVICLSIMTSGTLAYFSSSDTARNVITSGTVEIQVIEQQRAADGTLQPYGNQPIPVMPATSVSKIVSVQSMEQEAWIRMNYNVTVYDADGEEMDISQQELEKVITIEPDTAHWTWKAGWWYYSLPIQSRETTKPLFEEVRFSGAEMDNKFQCCTVVVDVTAQAVQKANNGTSVMEAQGWPVNEGGGR